MVLSPPGYVLTPEYIALLRRIGITIAPRGGLWLSAVYKIYWVCQRTHTRGGHRQRTGVSCPLALGDVQQAVADACGNQSTDSKTAPSKLEQTLAFRARYARGHITEGSGDLREMLRLPRAKKKKSLFEDGCPADRLPAVLHQGCKSGPFHWRGKSSDVCAGSSGVRLGWEHPPRRLDEHI